MVDTEKKVHNWSIKAMQVGDRDRIRTDFRFEVIRDVF